MQISRTRAERNDPKQWAATAGSMQPAIKRAVAAFMATYQPHPRGTPRPAHTYRIARRNAAKVARRAAA
jgi:hypothetical protein